MVGVVDVDAFGGEVGVAELGEGVADGLVGAFGLSGGAEGRGEVLGGFGAELLSSWGGEVCGVVEACRGERDAEGDGESFLAERGPWHFPVVGALDGL